MATEYKDKIIVAIELGSSKVTGLTGYKRPDGVIEILAYAQEPSTAFVRKGRINNVSKMTQAILNIKDKMEKKIQRKINKVYVGIGGMGMHTVANTVVRHFDSKIEVTQPMVYEMSDENRESASPERDILESIPQEYRLGTQLQTDPVGILSDTIEGHYLNIVANLSVREEIRNCFRNAATAIADSPITVLALADTMLSESEKRSGCVFVDMGAETTSVAVYKNNLLRHLAVIPLGGANVTRDIMSLQVEDDEAEALKLKYGTAVAPNASDIHPTIELRDGRSVRGDEFCGLVEARMDEIILNIKHQIELSPYNREQLIGGIIVTGGASHMKDIDQAFVKHTEFDKIRFVRKTRVVVKVADAPNFNSDGDFNAAIALIDKGYENCCGASIGEHDLFDEPTPEATEEKDEQPTKGGDGTKPEGHSEDGETPNKPKGEGFKKFKKFFEKLGGMMKDVVSEKDEINEGK